MHQRERTAAAEGAADARQFVDAILMHGEAPRVPTGSRVRPMRANRQVERLNGSRAGARLQANAVWHREPPVSTRRRVAIGGLFVQRPLLFSIPGTRWIPEAVALSVRECEQRGSRHHIILSGIATIMRYWPAFETKWRRGIEATKQKRQSREWGVLDSTDRYADCW